MLRKAVKLGYEDYNWLRNDPDLESLAQYPAFVELKEDLGL